MIGQTVSHYRIVEKIGEGGMGVVWKAQDLELGRFVAMKSLPAGKSGDSSRRSRFLQEAQTASALNHPNIVTIFDLIHDATGDYVVMEFVEGKTLDQLVPRGGMRTGPALRVAVQITDALTAAHRASVVHRDLKPGNIMVTSQGTVKILDFGLAKLLDRGPIGEDDATRTQRLVTEEGALLGTLSYMSPEQAQGQAVDARSDIFSLGAVLHEMFSGRRAFQGESKAATLAAVLREEPKPLAQLVEGVPREIERIVTRCLRKNVERRFQNMSDLHVALLELKEETESSVEAGAPVQARASRRWQYVAALGLAVVAGGAYWLLRPPKPEAPVAAARTVPLTSFAGSENSPSFSPDGNQIAFSWDGEKQDNFDVYVKLIDAPAPLRLTTDPAPDRSPAWSPDGKRIAFLRRRAIFVIPAIGGPERKVVERTGNPGRSGSVSWHPDGQRLIASMEGAGGEGGLALIPVDGGEVKFVTNTPPGHDDDYGTISPDGKYLSFARALGVPSSLIVKDLEIGVERTLVRGGSIRSRPAWAVDSNSFIFANGGQFLSGILSRVRIAGGENNIEPVAGVGPGADEPALSRAGPTRLAFSRFQSDTNIWKFDVAGRGESAARPLIVSTSPDQDPAYSPDGKRIALISYRSGHSELWQADSDGSNARQLSTFDSVGMGPPRWAPNGREILFPVHREKSTELYVASAEGGSPRKIPTPEMQKRRATYSRDGRWIYLACPDGTQFKICRLPAEGRAIEKISKGDGTDPTESFDGKLIYFARIGQRGIWSMPAAGGDAVQVTDKGRPGNWALAQSGLYFVDWDDSPTAKPTVYHYSFRTKRSEQLFPLSKRTYQGPSFSVSPDERSILIALYDEVGSDLMLIENFK